MMVTVAVMMNPNVITVLMMTTMIECGDDNDDNLDDDYVNVKIL